MKKKQTDLQPQPVADRRLANLAMELGVAGAQVLTEDFGFTQEQAHNWFDKMLARATANRAASATAVLDEWQQGGNR